MATNAKTVTEGVTKREGTFNDNWEEVTGLWPKRKEEVVNGKKIVSVRMNGKGYLVLPVKPEFRKPNGPEYRLFRAKTQESLPLGDVPADDDIAF